LWSLPSWANKHRFLFLQILCFDFIVTIRRWRSVSSMWLLSQEISNRMAECTRLIRVWGSLRTHDQRMEEYEKDTRILEWFRSPERKTLRPLVYCINVCVSSFKLVF
jgi:hypothetical protein